MANTKESILQTLSENDVKFLRLQFSDVLGMNKNVEVPSSQFEKALDGEIMFDGSSIEGFTRIHESDMLLKPDLDTFLIFPHFHEGDAPRGKVARVICDVTYPDGTPFEGDPRTILKNQLARLEELGFDDMFVGPEPEFFLFQVKDGEPTVETHDKAGYFDLAPLDKGERCRRDICNTLVEMGFEIEAAHHEVAQGQHEIDFRYENAVTAADNIATFRFIVKRVAQEHGLHATFMPKPIHGVNGSGMHCHLSLFKNGENAFYDEDAPNQLGKTALHFIAGLINHAPAVVALSNPTVNSYKRLTPGYEAPTNIAWSASNRSAMIRIPARRGAGTRCEFRAPDPSCNPYLALAAMLAAGLDGIEKGDLPPEEIQEDIFTMSEARRNELGITELPGTLKGSLEALAEDDVVKNALGEHAYTHFVAAKTTEWESYRTSVHKWELDAYLVEY